MVGFIVDNNGKEYAGKHLLIDAWGCKGDLSSKNILDICEKAAIATGATVLFKHAHDFNPVGSSGVIILGSSHITWHFWPQENSYIAFDIFVCGEDEPMNGLAVIENELLPDRTEINFVKRGIVE